MARHIDQTLMEEPSPADTSKELLISLTKLIKHYPPQTTYPKHELHGIYSGPMSIALLFFYISKKQPELLINDPHCGVANETLAYLAVATISGNIGMEDGVEAFLNQIPALTSSAINSSPTPSNEWLYGRAGTLYLLRLLRQHTTPNFHLDIDRATTSLIDIILTNGPPWQWHGKEYIGAVHGTAGILAQILLSDPKRAPQLKAMVEDLLDIQDPDSGNWPSSVESGKDHLVQFCHGAPGVVISLLSMRKVYVKEAALVARIDDAIEKGRHCIASRGILTKEPCLCHGTGGNAIALADKDREKLMRWCQAGQIEKMLEKGQLVPGVDLWGLYCGEAGRAWSWIVAEGWGKGMLGFNEL